MTTIESAYAQLLVCRVHIKIKISKQVVQIVRQVITKMKVGKHLANFALRVDFKVLQVGRLAKHALVEGTPVNKVHVHQVYAPFVPLEQ